MTVLPPWTLPAGVNAALLAAAYWNHTRLYRASSGGRLLTRTGSVAVGAAISAAVWTVYLLRS